MIFSVLLLGLPIFNPFSYKKSGPEIPARLVFVWLTYFI